MKIKAVIFDMDGLMFDTERLWLDAVKRTNEEYGYNVPESLIIECIGNRVDRINEILAENMGDGFDPIEFRKINKMFMNEDVEKNGLRKKKGLDELLSYLEQTDLKVGVASSSKKERVEQRFEQSGVSKKYFDVIVCGDQITEPKPAPEIYEKVCGLLGVEPSEAIALEDSENGLLSAMNAGVKAVWIPDIKIPSQSVIDKIYKKFNSLDEVVLFLKNEKTQKDNDFGEK